jgi:hypothetical protein
VKVSYEIFDLGIAPAFMAEFHRPAVISGREAKTQLAKYCLV